MHGTERLGRTMYDDLVERLRYCAVSDNQCLECKYRGGSPDGSKMCLDLLMEDATNAIEEMSMRLHSDEAAIAGMKREIERMVIAGKPRWIPVTERLPESFGDDVLVTDGEGCAVGYWRPDAQAWDSTDFGWLENRSEPPCGIHTVTHWMPLTEPPKEEA